MFKINKVISNQFEKLRRKLKIIFCIVLNDVELLRLFLPELLMKYFEIIKFQEENEILHLYFEEKNTVSKGFVAEMMVDNFSLL